MGFNLLITKYWSTDKILPLLVISAYKNICLPNTLIDILSYINAHKHFIKHINSIIFMVSISGISKKIIYWELNYIMTSCEN